MNKVAIKWILQGFKGQILWWIDKVWQFDTKCVKISLKGKDTKEENRGMEISIFFFLICKYPKSLYEIYDEPGKTL